MVRVVKKVKNVEIFNAMKGLGKLTDADYAKLEKKLSEIKDFSTPQPFDEKSDIILGMLPDSQAPQKMGFESKDGRDTYKVSLILPDGTWASFLTKDDAEVKEFESHLGNVVAVVGKIVPKEGEKGIFQNIKPYRGAMIIVSPEIKEKVAKQVNGEEKNEFE